MIAHAAENAGVGAELRQDIQTIVQRIATVVIRSPVTSAMCARVSLAISTACCSSGAAQKRTEMDIGQLHQAQSVQFRRPGSGSPVYVAQVKLMALNEYAIAERRPAAPRTPRHRRLEEILRAGLCPGPHARRNPQTRSSPPATAGRAWPRRSRRPVPQLIHQAGKMPRHAVKCAAGMQAAKRPSTARRRRRSILPSDQPVAPAALQPISQVHAGNLRQQGDESRPSDREALAADDLTLLPSYRLHRGGFLYNQKMSLWWWVGGL